MAVQCTICKEAIPLLQEGSWFGHIHLNGEKHTVHLCAGCAQLEYYGRGGWRTKFKDEQSLVTILEDIYEIRKQER